MTVYTLKKKKSTAEYHLFEGEIVYPTCISNQKSICQKMNKSDSELDVFSCKSEEEARLLCAKHGRKVCGTCVSHLYESYK